MKSRVEITIRQGRTNTPLTNEIISILSDHYHWSLLDILTIETCRSLQAADDMAREIMLASVRFGLANAVTPPPPAPKFPAGPWRENFTKPT